MLTHTKCLLCKNNNTRLITEENNWKAVQCKSCGFVYVNPRPDEFYLKQHYQDYLPDGKEKINRWNHMMSGVFSKSLDIIDGLSYTKSKRLLDVGCGYGAFLEMAIKRKWNVSGIDLSEKAVLYARSKGLDVSNSTLPEKAYRDEEFDVVTMFYVLEHLLDPVKYLQEVYRILKPHGLLLVRVPHTTPIAKMLKLFNISNTLYDAPSHLSDFSPQTIKKMLKKVGFENIQTTIGGMTYPTSLHKRCISCFFGTLATFLNNITFGRYLLPGVSKTTFCRKKGGAYEGD